MTRYATILATLAAQHRITAFRYSKAVTNGNSNSSSALLFGGRVTYHRDLDTLPEAYKWWCAAHELAHFTQPRLRDIAVTLAAPIALVLVVPPLTFTTAHLSMAATVGIVALAACGLFAVLFGLCFPRIRRREYEADAIAADWGHPLTAECAAILAATDSTQPNRWGLIIRTHPYPHQRING